MRPFRGNPDKIDSTTQHLTRREITLGRAEAQTVVVGLPALPRRIEFIRRAGFSPNMDPGPVLCGLGPHWQWTSAIR